MPLPRYIWLLLCYANLARSSLMEDFLRLTTDRSPAALRVLPVEVDTGKTSGCICRSSEAFDVTVCYGFYSCNTFPKLSRQSETLKVKSTNIKIISEGDMDEFVETRCLEIDSNRNLEKIAPFAFRNLSNLDHLSISFNWKLIALEEEVFVGLDKLTNLTLVSNGFTSLSSVIRALRPNVLPAIQRLDLSENYIMTIFEDDFSPMLGSGLSELELTLCQTEVIQPKSFVPLEKLKSLHIGENNLNSTVIADVLLGLKGAAIDLNLLDISRMGFRKVPPRMLLEIIANTTITKLILAQNQFEFFMNDTFPRMENIELLDLRQVLIFFIEEDVFGPSKFPNLKVLLLSGNYLSLLHVSLSTHLQQLDLSYNTGSAANPASFDLASDTFRNMSHLEVLNLSYNRIVTIFNFTFRGLEQLRILSIKNGSIFQIEPFAFASMPHLEMLSLENNPFLQNNGFLNNNVFVGLTELKILILSNCGIRALDNSFFSVFPNLTHLILRANKLISLTPESLRPLTKLKVLDLSNNLIVSWLSPLFKPSYAPMHRLLLNDNKITRFTLSMLEDMQHIFDNASDASPAEVELLGNVFTCDCNSMYLTYSWLGVNGSDRLSRYFEDSQFTCTSPATWEHKRVFTYLSTFHGINCSVYHSKMRFVVITLVAIFVVLLVIAACSLIYVYRFYVNYWLFLAKLALGRRHSNSKQIASSTLFKYDAFVSYSCEDRNIVVEMLDELEANSPFFKLCVYDRDFEVGSFISDSIHNSINESRYVILVVSDHFAKSQWCRWETQMAEYHRLFLDRHNDYDPLILIRIGEVQRKHLTPTLKYLLKTKIYLKWEGQGKNHDTWSKLRKCLSKK